MYLEAKDLVIHGHQANHNGRIKLAEIQYFNECVVMFNEKATYFWVAHVNWYLEHPCKIWYGTPIEVWSTVISPTASLIPVQSIKSRVVYTKCTRNFGRRLVNDTVFVVSPVT